MEIREASAGDAAAASGVAEAAWWASCAAFLDADTLRRVLAEGYTEERLAEAFEDVDLHTPVAADDGGRVVGFAVAERTWADTVDLHALYVDPDRWGEGAGSALLDAVFAYARDEGVGYVRATAFLENPVAQPFFESRGFERTRTVETPVFDEVHEEAVLEREV
ncbi:MAG: GNAT family N-acetyltransferase [Haloarculaceae archaeon]